jgi:hypothetical protein
VRGLIETSLSVGGAAAHCSVADWPSQWKDLSPPAPDMAEDILYLDMVDIMDYMNSCDSTFCPPPLFDLPPPPPPPHLDAALLPACTGNCNTSSMDTVESVQQIFHNIIIIVISSLVIVITLLLAAVFIWR